MPFAVSSEAGTNTSAISLGTGRAKARVPRVKTFSTGAVAPMCRGGRMAHPTKVWRRWAVATNYQVRIQALASAVAASAVTALLNGRGHRIDDLSSVPLVVNDSVLTLRKTKDAVKFMKSIGLKEELQRCLDGRKRRTGVSRRRNRIHRVPTGPMLVLGSKDNRDTVVRAFRNIPGVDIETSKSLGLATLAPGGMPGRLIIWTEGAFKELHTLFGTFTRSGSYRKKLLLTQPEITVQSLDDFKWSPALIEEIEKEPIKEKLIMTNVHKRNLAEIEKKLALYNKMEN